MTRSIRAASVVTTVTRLNPESMSDTRPPQSTRFHALYQGARFLTAATKLQQTPADEGREVAFAGRSNAAKSSAINAICHQNALARTSKTPGRTQQLIFFELDETRRLVDLPGYGYAKVPKEMQEHWQGFIAGYFETRRALAGLVVVMDIRHPLKDYDRQMLGYVVRRGLPAAVPDSVKKQIKRADRISAWLEATQIAGFTEDEANRFFGRPAEALVASLAIRLRPPVEVRADYVARHAALMARLA